MARLLPVVGEYIPWDLLVPEAYLVLNPDCTAARLTRATTDLTPQDAAAWAAFAGRVLRLPVIYVEYSGAFGDMALLQAVRENAGEAHVVYGGGIRRRPRPVWPPATPTPSSWATWSTRRPSGCGRP